MDAANQTLSGTVGGGTGGGTLGATTGGGTLGATKGQHDGFRADNVRFLQEQNKEATRALDKVEAERDDARSQIDRWEERTQALQQQFGVLEKDLANTEDRCAASLAEIHKRDEQIRVLKEQNRSLLDMLEQEEATAKQREESVRVLQAKKDKLQGISDEYDRIKETGNAQLVQAYNEIAKSEEELRQTHNETEQLREAELNFRQQSQVDIEALEKKLKDAKDQNVVYLQQIQHNEVHEHRLAVALQRLRETLDELTVQKKGINMQLEKDTEFRDKWTQSKHEVESRKRTLEQTVEALRASLRGAEDHNQKMQDDNKAAADNYRQLGDKVYSLMDQLRQHQQDLRKQEQLGTDRSKKIVNLEKMSVQLQQSLQQEVDAKLAAEAEARSAAQMQSLLQKKNKMLDEAHQLALKAQEKVEKRVQELTDKAQALESQNEYLGSRIDGNESDRGALDYELKRVEEELRQATTVNAQIVNERNTQDDRENAITAEKAALEAEMSYVKREDMLDDTGRTKPILIESESKLIERLQVNEFLFQAQQSRNPVPMLVEKISHILELMHTAQTQSDVYLQDLERSNSMLKAFRTKNSTLLEKVNMCETWKMRALLKIAANEFEMRQSVKGQAAKKESHKLYLDGLQYGNKELAELIKVIGNYMKQESVVEIHLQDNSLDASSVPVLLELMDLCPYLSTVDLRRNRLDHAALSKLADFVERIPGVTSVRKDPVTGDITAKSGKIHRLTVHVEDQTEPDPAMPSNQDLFGEDAAGEEVDRFLGSRVGVSNQTKLQGSEAPGAPGLGVSRSVLPQQRAAGRPASGKLGQSQSDTSLLPKLSPNARGR